MTLADYIGSEQAREDVRELLASDKPQLPVLSMEDLCWVLDEVGAWRRVLIWDDAQNKELTANYRPDGDRFVVTDLGEGVRAACLRGLDLANTEHFDRLNALGRTLDDDFRQTAPLGWIELRDVKPADLPDALCRVMLASLKVAEVQP